MEERTLYRPPWTCGRYNEEASAAIYYNLVSGRSFYFEDESAAVIGAILEMERNVAFTLSSIETKTGIRVESLMSFFDILLSKGMVSTKHVGNEEENEYRAFISRERLMGVKKEPIHQDEDAMRSDSETAEKAYARRTGCPVTTVLIELTYLCSERCIHCYNPGASRNDSESSGRARWMGLDIEDYYRVIDELYTLGAVRVCLSGGDPFSYPHTWEIIEYLYKKEFAIEIFTNGLSLLGKTEKLSKFYPCVVGVSIYSSNPTCHDRITRIPGSFSRSIRVVEDLSKLSVPLEIKCCVIQTNLSSYHGVSEIASKCGAKYQLECSVFDSMDGDKCVSRQLRLDESQMELVLRDPDNPLYVGPELEGYGARPHNMSNPACSAGRYGICITPDGTILPCVSFHAALGNVNTTALRKIVYDTPAVHLLEEMILERYEECGRHPYCAFCLICPGLNFNEHGTVFKAAENNCFIARVRYNLSEKMKKGYDPLCGKTLSEKLAEFSRDNVIGEYHKEQAASHLNEPLR